MIARRMPTGNARYALPLREPAMDPRPRRPVQAQEYANVLELRKNIVLSGAVEIPDRDAERPLGPV